MNIMSNRNKHTFFTTTTSSHYTTTSASASAYASASTSVSTTPAHTSNMQTHCRFPWRLLNYCSKSITARSRRRRRRTMSLEALTTTPATLSINSSNTSNSNLCNTPAHNDTISLYRRYMRPTYDRFNDAAQTLSKQTATVAYVTLLILSTTCSLWCAASPCETHSWWDPIRDKCIPCTVCEGDMIPLRPCQLHRDTICGSIYDLKIDWVVLAKTEPNWKERRKFDDVDFNLGQQFTHEELQQLHEETLSLDWQTAALFLAVFACLLFFIVAACILIHHMRQWRRMERRLDQDVEELSTKLMAKLAEVQSLEGGTFFIGNADALRVPTTFQPQHVLLPEKSAKHHDRRILKTLQPGNVYIEENGSKG